MYATNWDIVPLLPTDMNCRSRSAQVGTVRYLQFPPPSTSSHHFESVSYATKQREDLHPLLSLSCRALTYFSAHNLLIAFAQQSSWSTICLLKRYAVNLKGEILPSHVFYLLALAERRKRGARHRAKP